MADSPSAVTETLVRWRNGDAEALNTLMPLVYAELRRLASSYVRKEYRYQTLETTALIHEAYLRLVGQSRADWKNRAHFFGVAAQLMRRILVDHARAHRAAKRGGGALRTTIHDGIGKVTEDEVDLLALDEALNRLANMDLRQSRIVEMRFFAGLSIEETAEALGVSSATVEREWSSAKAWLYNELTRR